MGYTARTKRAEHRPAKYRRHTSHAPFLSPTTDKQMAVDTHQVAAPTEDGVNGHMLVDPPHKENVSKFAVGGLILPPPDIKCASHHLSLH